MEKPTKVILFDGVCNLCNSFVQFVIEHDHKKQFKFASLQSDYGQDFLQKNNLSTTQFNSFILQHGNEYYTESTAGLKVLNQLKNFKFTRFLLYFPPLLRNLFYRLIAKNRYLLFGRKNTCWLPTPELQERFL